MNIKLVSNSQKSVSILLIFSIFLVFSCSSNDSITGSPNQTNLSKPNDIVDISNPSRGDYPHWSIYSNSRDMIDLGYGFSIEYYKWKDATACSVDALFGRFSTNS